MLFNNLAFGVTQLLYLFMIKESSRRCRAAALTIRANHIDRFYVSKVLMGCSYGLWFALAAPCLYWNMFDVPMQRITACSVTLSVIDQITGLAIFMVQRITPGHIRIHGILDKGGSPSAAA